MYTTTFVHIHNMEICIKLLSDTQDVFNLCAELNVYNCNTETKKPILCNKTIITEILKYTQVIDV